MKTILTFIIVFGVIVIVHEFGHLFFAKRSGILVREFSIGMGPKIFSHRSNSTTYTLRILPIGGYVRMAGAGEEEVDLTPGMPISVSLNTDDVVTKINTSKRVQLTNGIPLEVTSFDLEEKLFIKGNINGIESNEVRYSVDHDATIIETDGTEVQIAPRDVQFQSAKLWQRMLTNFAGPLNNFLLSIFLFIIVVFMRGGVQVTSTNQLGEIVESSVAAKAGLEKNDRIESINGTKISDWEDFSAVVSANPDKEIELVVLRDGKELTISCVPEATKDTAGKTTGKLGVYPPIDSSIKAKITGGFQMFAENSTLIFKALVSLISNFNINKLSGPVGIFQLSSEAAKSGTITVIAFMAMLSVNLGIVNLLPIPALDGGKLVLNIIEGIRGKPLSQEKEVMITIVGFALVMILMILVTWNDIQRFFL